MARRERRERPAEPEAPVRDEAARQACCLVSEVLEEAGLDRESVRRLRRQVLQGLILLCQWQLERMDGRPGADGGGTARPRARRVPVEQG